VTESGGARGLQRVVRLARYVSAAVGTAPRPETAVLVLGMHRSGTSAVTRIVNLLGVPVGRAEGLLAGDERNAKGYWESANLMLFHEHLLSRLGGRWDAPPPLQAGWENAWGLALMVGRARVAFKDAYGDVRTFVFKDPRTSLTLPFWRRALRPRKALAIVVHRSPVSVAGSLEERDRMAKRDALALWETYNRATLRHTDDLPTTYVAYETLMSDPVGTAERIARFLARHGVPVQKPPVRAIEEFVDPNLRHHTPGITDLAEDREVTAAQRQLAVQLESLSRRSER
jgi:hypothetical protein